MDEPTAHIDPHTDALLQRAIRTLTEGTVKSGRATLLTIAHRLHTVADFDRVLVMDAGRLVEQGRPSDLLKQHGPFHRMVR